MTPVVRLFRTALSAGFALVVALPALQAADVTWTTGTSNGQWATGDSWQGGIAPATGDSVFFGATSGTTSLTYNIANPAPAWGGITFASGASAYTISGGTMTMAGGAAAIANDSTSLQTINSVFGSGFAVAGSGSLTLGGRIASGNITKNGSGVLTLSGSNSIGTVTANAGTVAFAATTATGTGTALIMNGGGFQTSTSLTVSSLAMPQAGTFSFTTDTTFNATVGSITGAGLLTVSGAGTAAAAYRKTLTLSGAANPEFSGGFSLVQAALAISNEASLGTNPSPVSMTGGRLLGTGAVASRTITVNGGTEVIGSNGSANFTLTGGITGVGGVSFRSTAGLVEIGGTNDYGGLTEVWSGDALTSTLRLVANDALPYAAGKGNVQLRPSAAGNAILDLNGRSLNVNGLLSSGNVAQQFIDIVSAGGSSTLTVGNADASGTFAGTIRNTTGTIKLTKVGSGTQVLSGTSNTYGGGTDISAGTLQFSRIGSMPASGTVAVHNGGTLAVNVGGAGEFTTATSGPGSIGGLLSGVGGQGNAVSWTGNVGLGIDTTAASGTYSGNITNVGTALGITKLGSNTLTLAGSNTYVGATRVNSGALIYAAAASSANSDMVIGNGSAITVSSTVSNNGGSRTISKSLTFNGYSPANAANYSMAIERTNTDNSTLSFGPLTLERGMANVSVLVSATTKNLRLNFDSLTVNNGSLMWLNRVGSNSNNLGTQLISSTAANATNIVFATAPTLSGSGAGGTTSAGILAGVYLTVGNGPSAFATYDSNFGVRQLNGSTEQVQLTSGMTAGQNARVTANTTLTANTSVNSLLTTGTITLGGNRLSVTSGMVGASNASFAIGSGPGDGTLDFGSANGYVVVDNNRTATINSVIAGSGGLTLAGMSLTAQPTIMLYGANTVTGTARFVGNNAPTMVKLLNANALANLTLDYDNSGAGFTFGNGGTTGLTAYTFGGLQGAQGIALTNNNTTPAAVALTVGGNGNSTTYGGVLSGAGGSLIKTGSGSLSLTAANTYSGPTIISQGTLALGVAGSFASSSLITVGGVGSFGAVLDLTAKTSRFAFGAGQTVGGIGTLRMDAGDTVQIAGLLSPGNSPGILTFDGGTTFLSGTTQMEIFGSVRGTDYDAIDLVNNAIIDYAGGTLFLDFGSSLAVPQTYQLFGNGSSTLEGSLSAVTIAGSNYTGLTFTRSDGVWTSTGASTSGQTLAYSESTGQLVIVVPEPGTIALAGVGVAIAGWTLRKRRRIAEMPRNPHNP